jgi:hypothetical protein
MVSTTLVANLPPVSKTPVANFASVSAGVVDTDCKFATGVEKYLQKICRQCQQNRWQLMGTFQTSDTLK